MLKLIIKPVSYLIFLLLCVGCSPVTHDNSQATLLQTPDWQLIIAPEHIPVERPLVLKLETSFEIQSVSAEIRGVSMYMGRIPLHWRKLSDTEPVIWQSEFLLGACTDPHMRWQLQLTLTLPDGSTQLQFVEFNSSW